MQIYMPWSVGNRNNGAGNSNYEGDGTDYYDAGGCGDVSYAHEGNDYIPESGHGVVSMHFIDLLPVTTALVQLHN